MNWKALLAKSLGSCRLTAAMLIIVAGTFAWSEGAMEAIPTPRPGKPNIEDYATIEGYTAGAPI